MLSTKTGDLTSHPLTRSQDPQKGGTRGTVAEDRRGSEASIEGISRSRSKPDGVPCFPPAHTVNGVTDTPPLPPSHPHAASSALKMLPNPHLIRTPTQPNPTVQIRASSARLSEAGRVARQTNKQTKWYPS